MRKLLYILCIIIVLISIVSCTPNRPEIAEDALIGTEQIMQGNEELKTAEVTVENGTIRFYLVPRDELVSEERLRSLGIDFMKVLAGYSVNAGLQGPSDESYGEIYDYYDVEIVVEGNREIIARGTKGRKDTEIQWQE